MFIQSVNYRFDLSPRETREREREKREERQQERERETEHCSSL